MAKKMPMLNPRMVFIGTSIVRPADNNGFPDDGSFVW